MTPKTFSLLSLIAARGGFFSLRNFSNKPLLLRFFVNREEYEDSEYCVSLSQLWLFQNMAALKHQHAKELLKSSKRN